MTNKRPDANEYATYYDRYVALVPEGDVLTILNEQLKETLGLLRGIPESRAGFRYAPEKWSIREVVGHMIDTERVFAYRALRFARNDKTPLHSFEQDDYIRNATFDAFPLAELADEFERVRQSSVFLFKHLDEAAWLRTGIASDNVVSVRALAYIMAGHELYHAEILRNRYLQSE
jgi:hypothetical protein